MLLPLPCRSQSCTCIRKGTFPIDFSQPQPNRPHTTVPKSMTLFLKWPLLCEVALVPAVLPSDPTGDVAWRVHQLPPGCHAGSQGREAGSCPEQSWDGTGSGIQIWNTPRSPALSWTCVDLVAALQSSDLVPFMASLYMQTICSYSEPCLTLPSFFPLFTSCMDHTPAFSVRAEGKMSLLSSLILSFPPFSVLLAFSFKCLFSSSRFQSCAWFLKLIKAVCPTVAGRC